LVDGWSKDNNRGSYVDTDKALRQLFDTFPKNERLEDVLLKATAVNSLYHTRIHDIVSMAKHIHLQKIDRGLDAESIEVVDKIALVNVGTKMVNRFSFATKYCNWHKPEVYPIYDSYVQKLLMAYRRCGYIPYFAEEDLRRAKSFKGIIFALRDQYKLGDFTLKQIDNCLWGYGKDLYAKKR